MSRPSVLEAFAPQYAMARSPLPDILRASDSLVSISLLDRNSVTYSIV